MSHLTLAPKVPLGSPGRPLGAIGGAWRAPFGIPRPARGPQRAAGERVGLALIVTSRENGGANSGTARCVNTERSLTHLLDCGERGLAVEPTQDSDTCPTWQGSTGAYQFQAALAWFRETSRTVQPWHWITTICEEPQCLDTDHMLVEAPRRLNYPSGVCVYCGSLAYTRDHLLPKAISGPAFRRWVLTVPACGQCNSIIGDRGSASISERRAIAQAGIRRRAARKLQTKVWTSAELDELGPTLRAHVVKAVAEKREVLARLAWPEDPAFDLRALQGSGIDDPYATGLLSREAA